MAVVSCVELIGDRGGDFDARQRARRYTRKFRVQNNDKADGPSVVQAYLSLPSLYSSYTSGNDIDTAAFVEGVRVKEIGFCLFDAEVSYSTITPDSSQNAENPVDRSPVVRWTYQSYQVSTSVEEDGTPIVNSAKDPFDPPLEREEKRPVLTVERYENMFSPGLALQYQYAVNEDVFLGVAAGYCRCNGIDAERHYEKGAYCWRVKYEFEFRQENFLAKALDQGFRKLDANGNQVAIRDAQQTPVSSPALLNGAGRLLSDSFTTVANLIVFANDAVLDVDDDVFPDPPFDIKIGDEIIHVGGKQPAGARTSLTNLIRGYRGTVAAQHLVTHRVEMQPVYLEFQIHRYMPFADLNIII